MVLAYKYQSCLNVKSSSAFWPTVCNSCLELTVVLKTTSHKAIFKLENKTILQEPVSGLYCGCFNFSDRIREWKLVELRH